MYNKAITLRQNYRIFRKWIVELLPFVKRSKFNKLKKHLSTLEGNHTEHYDQLAAVFTNLESHLANRTNKTIRFLSEETTNELCLFVTYSPESAIKIHVIEHVASLIAHGIKVVLIVNTNLKHEEIEIPNKLSQNLHGIMIRDNEGYDFGAWAHAYQEIKNKNIDRLYLINDSIVGPLNDTNYSKMIASIRGLDADFIGLTKNTLPNLHLQSFFLVINKKLLQSYQWNSFMNGVLNLPTKQHVIDCYETKLTKHLEELGFNSEVVYPYLAPHLSLCNDTFHSWDKLISIGFPFVKGSVLKEKRITQKQRPLIPERFLPKALSPEKYPTVAAIANRNLTLNRGYDQVGMPRAFSNQEFHDISCELGSTQDNPEYRRLIEGLAFWAKEKLNIKTALEIGSGPGYLLACLSNLGISTIGIDGNPVSRNYFQNKHPDKINSYKLDPYFTEQYNSAEAVFSIEVFEHIDDQSLEKIMDKINSQIKPKFIVFSSTPHAEITEHWDIQWGHINIKTPQEWDTFFERHQYIRLNIHPPITEWATLYCHSQYSQT